MPLISKTISKKKAKKVAHVRKLRAAADRDIMQDLSARQEKAAAREQLKQDREAEPISMVMGTGTTLGGPESHIY